MSMMGDVGGPQSRHTVVFKSCPVFKSCHNRSPALSDVMNFSIAFHFHVQALHMCFS